MTKRKLDRCQLRILLLSDYAIVHLCSSGLVTTSFLKPQEPFGGFMQCVVGQFSAPLLSEFQYLFPLTNFLTLWVLFVGHLMLVV